MEAGFDGLFAFCWAASMSSSENGQGSQDNTIQGVPLLDLARQHSPLRPQIMAALERICQSGAFVLGPDVTQLEQQMAGYCQAKHAIGCASGSDALLLALMALDISAGDEVILPSFTFFATASAVTRLGAKPVFADIDPQTFNINPEHAASLVTSATKAILPVHLFGQPVDTLAWPKSPALQGIAIVEDAAQAIGAENHGRRVGAIGAIGCFSFYPTKNLGGAGDGGMLTTQCDDLADRLRLLRGHGMRPRYYHSYIGINSRLDSFQAAVLNVKFPLLDHWIFLRRANRRPLHRAVHRRRPAPHVGPAGDRARHEARVEPVRGPRPRRAANSAPRGAGRGQDRHGSLLSAGIAPAAVLPLPGL